MLDAANPPYHPTKTNAQVLNITDMRSWYGKKAQGNDIFPRYCFAEKNL
jgi:hypothetical protein